MWYWCFSFWLTLLCIISSSFIHLIRTDSNVFFFNGWVIFHCLHVPQLSYPFVCWWTSRLLPCPVLTVASWPAYRFLKRQVRWSGMPISFRIFQFIGIHTVKGFGIVNKAEIDVFLSCFSNDAGDVGNLITGSSAFSKTSFNIWKFTVHVLLKPGLENFEHYFPSVWDECNCVVVWAFFGIAFLWDWNENWPFPVLWQLLSFPNSLAYWVQHFHSIIFQDLE